MLSAAILVSGCVLLSLLTEAEIGTQTEEPAQTPATPAPTSTPTPLYIADQSVHPALLETDDDGAFRPDEPMSRGEMAGALVRVLSGLRRSARVSRWTDLPAGDRRYRAAARLDATGLLPEDGGLFRPDEPVTGDELGEFLERLAERLTDEASQRALTLAGELAGGGDLTRRDAACVLVRLSGRTMWEEDLLFLGGCLPSDMTREDPQWQTVADAVTAGSPSRLEEGIYRIDGWLYAVDGEGRLVRDERIGVWSFGPDGGYTTGDRSLDDLLAMALQASGAGELTGREALEAVYLYVKNNFEYKVTPFDQEPEEEGSTGWEFKRAARFFQYRGGTCYGYAAAFGLLARCLGEDAKIVAATVNQYNGPHSFVVIPEDGTDWIYDVELEDARPERHGDLDLFRIQNYVIYNYWYTPDW